jgi:hypothetical protein
MDYIHPLTPLVNLPNLLGSEISMQLGLGSENSLFYSESSGAMALVDAFRNLNLLVSQLSLVVSAHAFGPHCLELYAANWEKLNQAENRWMPVEAGAALLMGTENGLLQAGLVPKLCLHKVEIIHKSADYNWSGCGNGLCVEPLLYLYSVLNSSESSGCVSIDHLDGAILNLEWERV